jgi:hypothetical protein
MFKSNNGRSMDISQFYDGDGDVNRGEFLFFLLFITVDVLSFDCTQKVLELGAC